MSGDMRIEFGFDADMSSANKVRQATETVRDSVSDLTKEIGKSQGTLKDFLSAKGVQNTLLSEIENINKAAQDAEKSLRQMATSGDSAGKPKKVRDLSGVKETVASGLGGAVGGDIGGLVSSLGGLGTAAGVAGVATAALSTAIAVASNEYDKARDRFGTAIAKQSEYFDLIETESTESLEQQRQALEERRAILEQEQALRNQQLEELRANTGVFGDVYEALSKGPLEAIGGQGSAVFDAAREAANNVNKEMEDLEGSLRNIEKALNSSEVAARDAANATLENAAQAGELTRLQLEAANASRESNQARVDAINTQKAVIEAELNALKSSGTESVEVTSRIESLTSELANLAQQSAILQTAINTTAESATDASEILQRTARETREVAQETEKTEKRVAGKSKVGIGSIFNAIPKAQKQALEDQRKALEEQLKKQKEFERSLLDSIEDFYADREQLEFEGDFRAIQQQERAFQTNLARSARDSNTSITQFVNNINNGGNTSNSFSIGTTLNQEQIISVLGQLLR